VKMLERIQRIKALAIGAKKDGLTELPIDTVIRAFEHLEMKAKETQGPEPVKAVPPLTPVRYIPYLKLVKWLSNAFAPFEDHIKAADVTWLHHVLHAQKCAAGVLEYLVTSTEIRVQVYMTAEYLHYDVATKEWSIRTPCEGTVEVLNDYLAEPQT